MNKWCVRTDHDATDERLSRHDFLAFPPDFGGDARQRRLVIGSPTTSTHRRRPSTAGKVFDDAPGQDDNHAGEEDDQTGSEVVEPVPRLQAVVDLVATLRCRHLDRLVTLWSV